MKTVPCLYLFLAAVSVLQTTVMTYAAGMPSDGSAVHLSGVVNSSPSDAYKTIRDVDTGADDPGKGEDIVLEDGLILNDSVAYSFQNPFYEETAYSDVPEEPDPAWLSDVEKLLEPFLLRGGDPGPKESGAGPPDAGAASPSDAEDVWKGQRICHTVREMGSCFRDNAKNREQDFDVWFCSDEVDPVVDTIAKVVREGLSHTGKPDEGDYLLLHILRIQASIYGASAADDTETGQSAEGCRGLIRFHVQYYSTLEQEKMVTKEVDEILRKVIPEGSPPVEVLKRLCCYVCGTVRYDTEHGRDYPLKHSAYAAAIDHSAVCQGIASLTYRLILSTGNDCRVIIGKLGGGTHAWLIVRVGDLYYRMDPTADLGRPAPGTPGLRFFLSGRQRFELYTRNEEYDTELFHRTYPMSEEDYPVVWELTDVVRDWTDREENNEEGGTGDASEKEPAKPVPSGDPPVIIPEERTDRESLRMHSAADAESDDETDPSGINGHSSCGWGRDRRGWRFLSENRGFLTGWQKLPWNGKRNWYHFGADGYMTTGWYQESDGKMYYLHPLSDGDQGYMYTGRKTIEGDQYYFDEKEGFLKDQHKDQ